MLFRDSFVLPALVPATCAHPASPNIIINHHSHSHSPFSSKLVDESNRLVPVETRNLKVHVETGDDTIVRHPVFFLETPKEPFLPTLPATAPGPTNLLFPPFPPTKTGTDTAGTRPMCHGIPFRSQVFYQANLVSKAQTFHRNLQGKSTKKTCSFPLHKTS